jgi:hypothetical protein
MASASPPIPAPPPPGKPLRIRWAGRARTSPPIPAPPLPRKPVRPVGRAGGELRHPSPRRPLQANPCGTDGRAGRALRRPSLRRPFHANPFGQLGGQVANCATLRRAAPSRQIPADQMGGRGAHFTVHIRPNRVGQMGGQVPRLAASSTQTRLVRSAGRSHPAPPLPRKPGWPDWRADRARCRPFHASPVLGRPVPVPPVHGRPSAAARPRPPIPTLPIPTLPIPVPPFFAPPTSRASDLRGALALTAMTAAWRGPASFAGDAPTADAAAARTWDGPAACCRDAVPPKGRHAVSARCRSDSGRGALTPAALRRRPAPARPARRPPNLCRASRGRLTRDCPGRMALPAHARSAL